MSVAQSGFFRWKLHGDGTSIAPGDVVLPGERLSWPRTIGIGAQHVVAMFGATFLVPLLTGFPPSTTLFFSAIGTLLFFLITAGRLPSYLGSSFALISPILAVSGTKELGPSFALGGIIATGATLALVGIIVHFAGVRWIDAIMPPTVTGAIVALIGLNLAPAAWNWVKTGPITAVITILSICLITVLFKGIIGRLSILFGVLIGYVAAVFQHEVKFDAVREAAWFGLPQFHTPSFSVSTLGLFIPVVFVLIAENVGHVKSVSAMTGENLDDLTGRALFADGVSTMLAGALIATLPPGVLGGAGTVLYGMIGMLGVRIWVQNRVDFANPVNLNTAAIALIVAIADFTWNISGMTFGGIALGTAAAIIVYHGMRGISKLRGTNLEQASPASAPAGSELESEPYASRHRSTQA